MMLWVHLGMAGKGLWFSLVLRGAQNSLPKMKKYYFNKIMQKLFKKNTILNKVLLSFLRFSQRGMGVWLELPRMQVPKCVQGSGPLCSAQIPCGRMF